MEFSRDEKNVIRCRITEEEIEDLGYTIDDLIQNGARSQEFMNRIFDLAEDELQIKFGKGIKTVRADLLPDHTLTLTFSENPPAGNLVDHIKEVLGGLIGSTIGQEKWEELVAKQGAKVTPTEVTEGPAGTMPRIVLLLAFEEMDGVFRFAKQVPEMELPFNDLYKLDDIYFLMLDMSECEDQTVRRLSIVMDEYATDVFAGAEKRAFIHEHGKKILAEKAIETLKQI